MKFDLKNIIHSIQGILFCVLFLLGCAQDKDTEDYRREKIEEENAKAQSLVGDYNGVFQHLGAEEEGSGNIHIRLSAESKITTPPGGNKPEEQVVIRSKVEIGYGKKYKIVFPEGFYDSESRIVKSSISLALKNESKPVQIDFTLIIDSENKLKGKIEAVGYPNFGGQFEATKDTPLPVDQAPVRPESTFVFEGGAQYQSSQEERFVEAHFLNNNLTDEEEIIDLLVPYQIWQMNFKLSPTFQLSFGNAQWDRSSGTLSGRTKITRGLEVFDFVLYCKELNKKWSCEISSSQNGVLFTGEFSERAKNQPPKRAPGDYVSGTQPRALPHFFSYTSFSDGVKRPTEILLRKPLPTTDQEFKEYILNIYSLHGTLKFSQSLQILFNDLEWNTRAGTLEGKATYTTTGVPASGAHDISLKCILLNPAQFHEGMNCSIESNQGFVAEQMNYTLKPKQLPKGVPGIEDQNQIAVTENFKGTGTMHNGNKEPMKLTLFLKKLTPAEEFIEIFLSLRVLDATLIWTSSGINSAFQRALWDKNAKTLIGEATYGGGGDQYYLKLECSEKNTEGSRKKMWSCKYFTNQWGLTTTVDFYP